MIQKNTMPLQLLIFIFLSILLSCSERTTKEESEYALLDKLRESPEQTKKLCKESKNQAVLAQCKKMQQRPHLYKEKKREQTGHKTYNSPLESTPASQKACTDNIVRCRTGNARNANSQEERVAECKSLERAIWKSECLFETAEAGLQRNKLSYAESAELCSLSESLVYNCLQHLSIVLADRYTTIHDAKKGMSKIETYWQAKDVGQSKKMKTIFWMTFIEMYINKKKKIEQDIFTLTDPSLHPYIWAALTKRILDTSKQKKSLTTRTQSLLDLYHGKKSILLHKNTSHQKQRISKKRYPKPTSDIVTVRYHGEQKRVLGETAQEEIEICFIMAAFGLQKHLFLIKDAMQSSSPLVVTVAQTLE